MLFGSQTFVRDVLAFGYGQEGVWLPLQGANGRPVGLWLVHCLEGLQRVVEDFFGVRCFSSAELRFEFT